MSKGGACIVGNLLSRFYRFGFFLFALMVVVACNDGRESQVDDSAGGSCVALAEYASQIDSRGFSGVLGVVRDGEELLLSAHGECERSSEILCEIDTVFDIGSVTKQFTAAAILKLEESGVISVDDTLSNHFADIPADKADISLHQLLTHTAGLPESIGFDYDEIDRDSFVSAAMSTPLVDAPGNQHLYSNVGYSLLAAVIENITGDSYERYLSRELFSPSGMMQTGYTLPAFDDRLLAHGYRESMTTGAPNTLPWDEDGPWWHLRGNGGILSNVRDLMRWHDALTTDVIVSALSKEKMYTPWVDEGDGDTFYGYGWSLAETEVGGSLITHDGGNGFFFANYLRFVDAGVVITILTNAYQEWHDDIADDLTDIAFSRCT